MFEQELTRIARARRALREFVDLSACRIFTLRQQLAWALACALIGAAAVVALSPWWPVRAAVLAPEIERAGEDYSVFRIPFEFLGAETWCHIVIYGKRGKWTVRCS